MLNQKAWDSKVWTEEVEKEWEQGCRMMVSIKPRVRDEKWHHLHIADTHTPLRAEKYSKFELGEVRTSRVDLKGWMALSNILF